MLNLLIAVGIIYALGLILIRIGFKYAQNDKPWPPTEYKMLKKLSWFWPPMVVWLIVDKYLDKQSSKLV